MVNLVEAWPSSSPFEHLFSLDCTLVPAKCIRFTVWGSFCFSLHSSLHFPSRFTLKITIHWKQNCKAESWERDCVRVGILRKIVSKCSGQGRMPTDWMGTNSIGVCRPKWIVDFGSAKQNLPKTSSPSRTKKILEIVKLVLSNNRREAREGERNSELNETSILVDV